LGTLRCHSKCGTLFVIWHNIAHSMEKSSTPHRATERVLELYEYLAQSGDTTTLAALSTRMGVAKSSLLPLLRTLVERKWLEQPMPATYKAVSPPSFGLHWAVQGKELPEIARPFLVQLAMQTGESSVLAVLPPSGDSVVYLDKVDSPQSVRYVAELGATRPLHCTSSGLAILAFMPPARRAQVIRALSLSKFTSRTVTDRKQLEKRLEEVARTGVASNVQEYNLSAAAVAAPIRDAHGEVKAACALAGPSERMVAALEKHQEAVKTVALAISAALGWRPGISDATHEPSSRPGRATR
jgi:DNA-binding IclR family transcriptional regulator